MAASGTGLPGGRGDVATTLVDTRSYGAAEQATADGFALAARGFDNLVKAIEPAANDAARVQAEQMAAAGEFEQRILITGADASFNDAMQRGTMARLGNQRDADLDALRVQHAFDPAGYARAAGEYRTNALQAAVPGELAIPWGQEFDERSNRQLSTIRSARANADLTEARADLINQNTRLIGEAETAMTGAPLDQAWNSDETQTALLRVTRNIDALEANPAFGVSPEEADAMRLEAITKIKGGAARSYVVGVLRAEGPVAAITALQSMATAEEGFSSAAERDAVVSAARSAMTDEINLTNQRRNQVESERSAREQEGLRAIEEDVARFALTGESSGLTEDQVRAYGGDDFVLRWRKSMADAADDRELYRDLPLDPEEAAIEISRRASSRGLADGLPVIADEGGLDGVIEAISQVETPGASNLVSADPDGAGPAGGGAYGDMQILPATAQRIAAKLNLPYDQNRLLNDVAYNRQIGREYMRELTDRYRGDVFLAITAYHAGEGNVDGWLSSVGDPRSGNITREDWLNGVEARGNPRSAAYPRKVLAAMNQGRAGAAWDTYRQQRVQTLADPAQAVLNEPDVNAALTLLVRARQGQGDLAEAGGAFVAANLAAQQRRGIPSAQRRALPMRQLVTWAGYLQRNQADPDAFQAATDVIMDTFGEQAGPRVLQDALIVRGNTAFAAQVAAAATGAARAGLPPPSAPVVRGAQRAETINRAATGGDADLSQMSTEELRRAAGL
jgi:hypothetical protein